MRVNRCCGCTNYKLCPFHFLTPPLAAQQNTPLFDFAAPFLQVKGAFLKDLSVLGVESTDMSRTVLVDNNPLSFICQPTNGILVASFYDDPNDTALASVMQLIRHLDHAGDVRPILKDMFRLDTLLGEYQKALFEDDEDAGDIQDVDCILDDEEEEEELLEHCLEEGADDAAAAFTAGATASPADASESLLLDVSIAEAHEERGSSSSSSNQQPQDKCRLKDGEIGCLARRGGEGGLKDEDDDDESVKTEACSEGSGDSSLGDESLTSGEEMELGF